MLDSIHMGAQVPLPERMTDVPPEITDDLGNVVYE